MELSLYIHVDIRTHLPDAETEGTIQCDSNDSADNASFILIECSPFL